jgi:hypothetical protein
VDGSPEHLEATADAHHRRSPWRQSAQHLRDAAAVEPRQVGDGRLAARDDDQVGTMQLLGPRGVAEGDAGLARQRIEVVEVGDVGEPCDRDSEHVLARRFRELPIVEWHAVFLREADVAHHRDDAENRQSGALLQDPHAVLEERRVAAEAVHDEAADERALLGLE